MDKKPSFMLAYNIASRNRKLSKKPMAEDHREAMDDHTDRAEHMAGRHARGGLIGMHIEDEMIKKDHKKENEEMAGHFAKGGSVSPLYNEKLSAHEHKCDESCPHYAMGGLLKFDERLAEEDHKHEHPMGMFARGGRVAAAIRERMKMARGGMAVNDVVDLDENAIEPKGDRFTELKPAYHEVYDEDDALSDLDYPDSYNQYGDEEEKESEDKNDRVDRIRKKMKARMR
jgi:hypothetical protein